MNHFRFLDAHFPDPAYTKAAIVERLGTHQRKLESAKKGQIRPLKTDGDIDQSTPRISDGSFASEG